MEKMNDFFAARVDGYDEHMLNDVEGCKAGYKKMAVLIPEGTENILDLGCGTGLELDEIFRSYPGIRVTGIDLTTSMLDKLSQKHPDKNLNLINASYFDCDLGCCKFDVTISFQTMHHYEYERKLQLYSKIHSALKDGGKYIECDYMVEKQEEQDFFFNENIRLRKELNISIEEFYHYDIPFTIDNQLKMLLQAGFLKAEKVFRENNTTIIVAEK